MDYFCTGPCWPTPTKPGRHAPGLPLVRYAASLAPARPWFAIGGIDAGNLDQVLEAGARRIVVVRALTEAGDPGAAASALAARLRPGGRLLNHAIMAPSTPTGPLDPFINRYIFPDGELHSVGHVTTVMNDHGFEIRHEENFREHYAMTLRDWSANLDEHWDEAVAEVGLGTARVWGLYMASSRIAFERNEIQLHQVLGVRTTADGVDGLPLRPTW